MKKKIKEVVPELYGVKSIKIYMGDKQDSEGDEDWEKSL